MVVVHFRKVVDVGDWVGLPVVGAPVVGALVGRAVAEVGAEVGAADVGALEMGAQLPKLTPGLVGSTHSSLVGWQQSIVGGSPHDLYATGVPGQQFP